MRAMTARRWAVLAGALGAALVLVLVLQSSTPGLGAAAVSSAIYKTEQVRGESTGGPTTVEFRVGGFTPGTTVYLALVGWSFEPIGGDHLRDKVGIWTQKAIAGGWEWSNQFPVDASGEVRGQFYVMCNSEDNNDPFYILINFLLIGQ